MKFLRVMEKYESRTEIYCYNISSIGSVHSCFDFSSEVKTLTNNFYFNHSGNAYSFNLNDANLAIYETNDFSLYRFLKMIFPKNNVKVKFKFF